MVFLEDFRSYLGEEVQDFIAHISFLTLKYSEHAKLAVYRGLNLAHSEILLFFVLLGKLGPVNCHQANKNKLYKLSFQILQGYCNCVVFFSTHPNTWSWSGLAQRQIFT